MNKTFKRGPSLTAFLGLLAIAGWQNRERISEMLADARKSDLNRGDAATPLPTTGFSALLSDVARTFTGATAGRSLSSGLGELVQSFSDNGRPDAAESWVSADPNEDISEEDLEAALGSDLIARLSERTGLETAELRARLTRTIPEAVDRFTPQGRIPTEEEGFRAI